MASKKYNDIETYISTNKIQKHGKGRASQDDVNSFDRPVAVELDGLSCPFT